MGQPTARSTAHRIDCAKGKIRPPPPVRIRDRRRDLSATACSATGRRETVDSGEGRTTSWRLRGWGSLRDDQRRRELTVSTEDRASPTGGHSRSLARSAPDGLFINRWPRDRRFGKTANYQLVPAPKGQRGGYQRRGGLPTSTATPGLRTMYVRDHWRDQIRKR